MPLLSAALPPYTGPHGVGAIDLEIPVPERLIGKITLKATGKPVFKVRHPLDTIFSKNARPDRNLL